MPCPRKILLITSSGGGGLLQAALAKEQEERLNDPSTIIVRRDMLRDWFISHIGRFSMWAWNRAQKQGDVATLERLIRWQWVGDIVFWPIIFIKALRVFFKEEVDHVIDTQPICTAAILRALHIYNKRRGKEVVLHKVVVDLPTTENTHYFRPLKWLFPKERRLIRLVTIPPLLKEGQTEEAFWHAECRLPRQQVIYEYYPVRQAFRKLQDVPRSEGNTVLAARISHPEEGKLVARSAKRGPCRMHLAEDAATFTFPSQDKVFALLLGSQPAFQSTLAYVKKFIRLAQEEGASEVPLHLLVLCGSHAEGEQSLLRAVSDLVVRMKDYPPQLSIIPLSVQSDRFIAPLFHRCDLTCTRSGGQTAMELMCVMKGEIWIHSEADVDEDNGSPHRLAKLLKGIPGWEAGSALYLKQFWGAKIVTPQTCLPFGRKVLKKSSSCLSETTRALPSSAYR